MENRDKKDSKKSIEEQKKSVNKPETDGDDLENFQKIPHKQTNAEIAEQGFTVRDGHDPDKPNPYEKPIRKKNDSEGIVED
ncbi:MAG TPA: hypothetical protein VJ780_08815 [Flavobacterium sp.]|nr:hypothetical protein [Flavobacterium sp.]